MLILKTDHIYAVGVYAIQQVEPEMENIICSLVTTCCRRGNAVHADVVRTTKFHDQNKPQNEGKMVILSDFEHALIVGDEWI